MSFTYQLNQRFAEEPAHILMAAGAVPRMPPSPDDAILRSELSEQIETVLSTLTPREALVIRMRFGLGRDAMTQDNVGRHFDVTRERIRQIEVKALRKLRHPSRSKALRDFWQGAVCERPERKMRPVIQMPKPPQFDTGFLFGHWPF